MKPRPTPQDFGLTKEDLRRREQLRNLTQDLERARKAQSIGAGIGFVLVATFIGGGTLGICIGLPVLAMTGSEELLSVIVYLAWGLTFFYLLNLETEDKGKVPKIEGEIRAISPGDEVKFRLKQYDEAVAQWGVSWKRSEKRWSSMNGHKFEKAFAKVLIANGWKAEATSGSGDQGVDIKATDRAGRSVWIQCKRWKQRCGVETVREMVGTMTVEGSSATPVIVCTGGFTKGACEMAAKAKVQLWGIDEVMRHVEQAL